MKGKAKEAIKEVIRRHISFKGEGDPERLLEEIVSNPESFTGVTLLLRYDRTQVQVPFDGCIPQPLTGLPMTAYERNAGILYLNIDQNEINDFLKKNPGLTEKMEGDGAIVPLPIYFGLARALFYGVREIKPITEAPKRLLKVKRSDESRTADPYRNAPGLGLGTEEGRFGV